MIWAMPVSEDQARASACDYDGTVAHDGQLDEKTVAEPVRLADIGRKGSCSNYAAVVRVVAPVMV
jgi:hypothetical protein